MESKEAKQQKTSNFKKTLGAAVIAGLMGIGGCAAPSGTYSNETPTCEEGESAFRFRDYSGPEGRVLQENEKLDGPAVAKPDPATNDIIVVESGASYPAKEGVVVWEYEYENAVDVEDAPLHAQTQFFGDEDEIEITVIEPEE